MVKRGLVIGMAMDYGKLGERVRKRRERGRMSQARLAEEAKVSTQHISNIENAKTKVSLEKLVDIANVLDCSVDELLCDSLVKAKVIYANEAAGLFDDFSDMQMRTLPEFLSWYTYFCRLIEQNLQQKDV